MDVVRPRCTIRSPQEIVHFDVEYAWVQHWVQVAARFAILCSQCMWCGYLRQVDFSVATA